MHVNLRNGEAVHLDKPFHFAGMARRLFKTVFPFRRNKGGKGGKGGVPWLLRNPRVFRSRAVRSTTC